MRIGQLRDYLDALIAAGVDPHTPVCTHVQAPAVEATEVTGAKLLNGEFIEDPSPQCIAYHHYKSPFLLLTACLDYDPMLNIFPARFIEIETGVEDPEKSWPNGHWFTEPRRKDGQL